MPRNLIVGTAYELQTNKMNTNGDNDLVVERNGNEFFKLREFTGNGDYLLIDVEPTTRLSCNHMYVNLFCNRTTGFDTTFQGSNQVADGGRVDYMRWNYTDQSVDFNAPIDNTGTAIAGK